MKTLTTSILAAAFASVLTAGSARAQTTPFTVGGCDPNAPTLGTIQLAHHVLADGKPLAPGTYQVRLTTEHPAPAKGQSEKAECWVEFVKNGAVVGREVATVISAEDIAAIAKGPAPKPNESRIDVLKGGEYVRIWMNRTNSNYIINLPIAREDRP